MPTTQDTAQQALSDLVKSAFGSGKLSSSARMMIAMNGRNPEVNKISRNAAQIAGAITENTESGTEKEIRDLQPVIKIRVTDMLNDRKLSSSGNTFDASRITLDTQIDDLAKECESILKRQREASKSITGIIENLSNKSLPKNEIEAEKQKLPEVKRLIEDIKKQAETLLTKYQTTLQETKLLETRINSTFIDNGLPLREAPKKTS